MKGMMKMAKPTKNCISESFKAKSKEEQISFINEMQPKLCQTCIRDNCNGCHFQTLTDFVFEN